MWTEEFFVGTVGKAGNEEVISNCVRNQGNKNSYKKLHKAKAKLWTITFLLSNCGTLYHGGSAAG